MHRSSDFREPLAYNRRQMLAGMAAGSALGAVSASVAARAARASPFNDHTNNVLRGDTKMKMRKLGTLEVSPRQRSAFHRALVELIR